MDETRRIVIRLDPDVKDEGEFLLIYDGMRASRRQDWARRQLLMGFKIKVMGASDDDVVKVDSAAKIKTGIPASALKGLMPG